MNVPKDIKVLCDKVELVSVGEIKVYEQNAKRHSKGQLELIRKSVLRFGFRQPLVLNNSVDKLLVCGHGRLLVAKELGLSFVPCMFAADLSEDDLKAFRIMDNKSGEGGWDDGLLLRELTDLNAVGFDLGFTGFSEEFLERLVGVPDVEGEDGGVSSVGVVDKLGSHVVVCPSCGFEFKRG